MTPRPLDHLVLPTSDLDVARERLARLGFSVAPEGAHPFGTRNACVYLADGTFLEPLAIGDAETVNSAVSGGNSFVAGDRTFREARGDEGLAALVFKTTDADADHDEFLRMGVSGGAMVEFSRPSIDAAGNTDIATFRLAFAEYEAAPDLFFFTCERRRAPNIDRSSLERHANGATRVVAVTARAGDARGFAEFLAKIARVKVDADETVSRVNLGETALQIVGSGDEPGVMLAEIAFAVPDLAATAALFKAAGIDYETCDHALRVPATAGQGADFVFEELP